MAVAISTAIGCNSSLQVALDRVVQAGGGGADVLAIGAWAHVNPAVLAGDFVATLAGLRAELAARKLAAVTLNTGTTVQLHDRGEESKRQRAVETAALCDAMVALGVKTAAIQPLSADKSRPAEVVMAACIASLREQYGIAAERGVRLAVELHVHSPFESLEQARALLEGMPEVRVVYDPTHFIMQGMPLRETAWIMDRAIHVHARDAAKGKLQTPLGTGEVDFDWVIGELRNRGYSGDVSIEYLETAEFDVVDSARRLGERFAGVFG